MRQNIRADIRLRLSGPNEGSPAFSPSEAITMSRNYGGVSFP